MFKTPNENSIIHYEVLKHSQIILFTIESCDLEWRQKIQIEKVFHIILSQWWLVFQFFSYHIRTPIRNAVHVFARKVVALFRKCCIRNKINTQWWQMTHERLVIIVDSQNQSKFINVSVSLNRKHDVDKVRIRCDSILNHVW
jgi:hypothetical protein